MAGGSKRARTKRIKRVGIKASNIEREKSSKRARTKTRNRENEKRIKKEGRKRMKKKRRKRKERKNKKQEREQDDYDPPPSGTPVGQFIAPKPLSKYNSKFSLTIMATGSFKTIAIGLVPRDYQQNQPPGMDSDSIGYQADDGGIFVECGWLMDRREKCDVGDVMEVEIDVLRKKGWFRKNGSQMFEFDLNTFGLYPCVGFCSKGTAVKLNEIKVWTAENKSDPTTTPNDFRTYMYDTLWISEMIYVKERDEACSGWVILHNPTHIPVAYKVTVGKNVYVKQGQLKPKKEFLDFVHICDMNKLAQINQTTVEWVLLESGREYSDKDLDRSLADMTETCTHILDVELLYASSVMPLLQEKEERLRQMKGQVDRKEMFSKSAKAADMATWRGAKSMEKTELDRKLRNMPMDKQEVSFHLRTELENRLRSIEKNVEFRIWLGTDIAKQTSVFVCLYRGLMQKTVASFMDIDIYYKDSETSLRPLEPMHKMPNHRETSLGLKDAELLQKAISINGGKLFEMHSNLEAITGSSFYLSSSRGCIQCPSVVLYCRVKGIAPLGEVAFPTTLSTGEDSPRVFTDVREGYLRQGMHQPNEQVLYHRQGNYQQSVFNRTDLHERLRMGTSIGVERGSQGTLGPFVKINKTEVGFLTCSHVIVSDPRDILALSQSVGLSVLQPADGETHPSVQRPIQDRCCGVVSRIVFGEQLSFPLHGLPKMVGVDAALITSNGRRHVDSRSFPFIPDRDLRNAGFDPHDPPLYGHGSIRYPLTFDDVQGARVIKYGATTGLTKGTLQLNGTMVKVHDADLKLPVNNASVIMKGQYVVEKQGRQSFFELGDSGAGVFMVDKENKLTCIGLGIGYLDEFQAVVTPIEYVLTALGLELDAMDFD